MAKLGHSFSFEIRPTAPYSFGLTMRKPAGWSLFTQFEVYGKDTVWTATHLHGTLAGIKLVSKGTTERPRVLARVFLKSGRTHADEDAMKRELVHCIGADEDIASFYAFARKDSILRHTIGDLYGMHNTEAGTVFPDAVLAILLQMTTMKRSNEMMSCLIGRYGKLAEFDGKEIRCWPAPEDIAGCGAKELARTCKLGYRAKHIAKLANLLAKGGFPTTEELERMRPEKAKEMLLELPGIGDYSADIINPHGGFPIDVWSADIFGKLFYGREPRNGRNAIERIKKEGLRRWGAWSWMAFFYVVQDLENLSRKMGIRLRLT
jgi:3-methyladenine DNA glycosylase/8-oxoguanine DNA glycosylase